MKKKIMRGEMREKTKCWTNSGERIALANFCIPQEAEYTNFVEIAAFFVWKSNTISKYTVYISLPCLYILFFCSG